MPRKVVTRKWLGAVKGADVITEIMVEFMVTGDIRHACRRLEEADAPVGTKLRLWQHDKMAAFWREHHAEIRREAKRRGVKQPHGAIYVRWEAESKKFDPIPPGGDDGFEDGPESTLANDPRRFLLH